MNGNNSVFRLFAAVVAIPAAIFWGVVFSFVTVFYVWCCSPALRYSMTIQSAILSPVMRDTFRLF